MSDNTDVDLTRRDLIKAGVAATVGVSLTLREGIAAQLASPSATAAAGGFFTTGELALADELAELIVPTDDHSPGARAAGVAAYINAQLAEAWDEKDRTSWRQGLRQVDQLSQQMHGAAFLQASPAQRVAVLTRMAANEATPKLPEEQFFAELKSRVVQAYYTSEIGIKQEMEYKGNSYLTEFVGTDVS